MEKLLFRGDEAGGQTEDSDWCNLAGLLGYEEERIAAFREEEHPVCALLSDWAGKDSASIDTLCTALRKINRDDVAQSLVLSPNPKPTATSVVWLQCKHEETTWAVAVIFYSGLHFHIHNPTPGCPSDRCNTFPPEASSNHTKSANLFHL